MAFLLVNCIMTVNLNTKEDRILYDLYIVFISTGRHISYNLFCHYFIMWCQSKNKNVYDLHQKFTN